MYNLLKCSLLSISFCVVFLSCSKKTTSLNQITPIDSINNQQNQKLKDDSVEILRDSSIDSLVINIISKYDHNRSGEIEYRDSNTIWKGIIGRNENNRTTRWRSSDRTRVSTYTMSKLFIASDKDLNGISTIKEINDFIIEKYDENKDGVLKSRGWKFWRDKEEYQYYKREVGEEIKSIRYIDHNQSNLDRNIDN